MNMERTMLSWNLANWLTVLLMAAAGYAVLTVAAQVLHAKGTPAQAGGF
jgi:hypothetical protein